MPFQHANHDLEDRVSKELFHQRQLEGQQPHRQLKKHPRHRYYAENKKKQHLPIVQADTQHGMMIDAGSQGTRIHIYEFKARLLHKRDLKLVVKGQKLSFPTTNTRWTNRLQPGLDAFGFIQDSKKRRVAVAQYLEPLLDFAMSVLASKKGHWASYPIFLKATGGMRTLPRPIRLVLLEDVRALFFNTTFNPFLFETEQARVISGEEEAIYGWAAVNFVQNTLLNVSKGLGTVNPNITFGMLEMGGASTQIGFFEPHGDVMANLFKLQIGSSKHWNVYAHSFLYFGVNGAYDLLNARLAAFSDNDSLVYNPCLPGHSNYTFTSRVKMFANETLLPLSSYPDHVLNAPIYTVQMGNLHPKGDFDHCYNLTKLLLRKSANRWCNFAHDLDCSFAGVYQPPLPLEQLQFIATSNFYHVWDFLQLPEQDTLSNLKTAAKKVCEMSWDELDAYNTEIVEPDELSAMCFRSVFVTAFLMDGIGFPESYKLRTAYVVNGQQLGWALGSMLYEINTLPWEFKKSLLHRVSLWGDAEPNTDTTYFGAIFVMSAALFALYKLTSRRRPTIVRFRVPEATPIVDRRPRQYGS